MQASLQVKIPGKRWTTMFSVNEGNEAVLRRRYLPLCQDWFGETARFRFRGGSVVETTPLERLIHNGHDLLSALDILSKTDPQYKAVA